MIDIKKAKEVLNKYVKKYDDTNPRIKLKKEHILRVSDNAKLIAQKLNLSQEDVDLAELIGLLHDIGRFEQLRIFNTYKDANSVDHAVKGLEVLFKQNLIREILKETDYDKIIYNAIKNHNKIRIEEGLKQRELLHAKIIRDADKLDIYNILSNAKIEDAVWFPIVDLSKEKMTDKVYENITVLKIVDYADMKTNIDCVVSWLAYAYDIYFKESLEIIKQKGYIDKIANRIDYKDKETKIRMQVIKEEVKEYIDDKLQTK